MASSADEPREIGADVCKSLPPSNVPFELEAGATTLLRRSTQQSAPLFAEATVEKHSCSGSPLIFRERQHIYRGLVGDRQRHLRGGRRSSSV